MKKNIKDIPLQEITLRKYEIPTALDDRELARKFLLSIGMLQPGDSRDIVVDVFHTLLKSSGSGPTFEQISETLAGKPGASSPNIRRQLRRLKDIKLVESSGDSYRIVESGAISELINNYLEKFIVLPSLARIKQYAAALEQRFSP